MAAPLIAVLPAIFSALWAGLVVCFKWLVEHAHVAKVIVVCAIIITAFKVGLSVYSILSMTISDYFSNLSGNVPAGVSVSASFLAKANYCLPISEMFALLAVYATFAGICLSVKFALASYKAIPFKSA